MQYGFVVPGGDPRAVVELARYADEKGWDGFFVPDCISIDPREHPEAPAFDPWAVLAAVAISTERIKMGTMLTPLSRRRPWKLARETTTIDQMSNGRLILPVGLGALDDGGFGKVGEATGRKVRAQLLDEGLAILEGLWSGQPFSFQGEHYHVDDLLFLPTPVQKPRIPVWVVGAWPRERSMQRALRWDGLLPMTYGEDGTYSPTTPAHIAQMKAYVDANRTQPGNYDIVMEGETLAGDRDQSLAKVRGFAEAGATWWLESAWTAPERTDTGWLRDLISVGPPRVD